MEQLRLDFFFIIVHFSVHTQIQKLVAACGYRSSCVTFTNSGWSRCDHASARNCINDASLFDAVSWTDYPALNPLLNPACHTKASCEPSYQCKHIYATLFAVITAQVKDGHISFWVSIKIICHLYWIQTGLEKVNSSVKAYIDEMGKTSSSYVD